MIRDFTELIKYLKLRGINPGFHFMDNEAFTPLKMKMTSITINYQLVPSSNHIANYAEKEIQTFKNPFVAGICSVDK